ncbi:MAG: carbonic anhydrase family protein [marine benthic group bacterium]|nr:carbonic anhydrase family protein [Candidatus Carthagonibacter metallireducens]MCL7969162.1 carbonic anhydrase family protein [Gemmatimonadota bacterium]
MRTHSWMLIVGLGIGAAACAPAETEVETTTATEEAPKLVSEVMTKEAQTALTPDEVFTQLKQGNERFVEGRLTPRDWVAQAEATASGQYPKAAVLSCLDSRVPPEIVFDQGIGDLFVGRIAGNFENRDMLGSLEFATAAAGTPLIVVLGHTQCGAIKGAVAGVELGNLTAMLRENLDEVLETVREIQAAADPETDAVVQAAIEENVRRTIRDILADSEVISGLVESGEVGIVGGFYDLATGRVTWLDT